MSTWFDLKNNPRLKEMYDKRMEILRLTREFFWSQGFAEAETPIAVRPPSQEPYLNPMPVLFHRACPLIIFRSETKQSCAKKANRRGGLMVELSRRALSFLQPKLRAAAEKIIKGQAQNADGKEFKFHLRTSPEFALKKLLAAGYEKIFEISKVFRDYEEFGRNHNPEFTMIEWYRAPGTFWNFMDDVENLFKFIGKALNKNSVQWKNKNILIDVAWDRKSMKEIWQEFLGIDLDKYLAAEEMKKLCLQFGYETEGAYEDLFYKIFLNKIEPLLGIERPVFIYDYPAQMCSLSQQSTDPRYAERAELYIGGLELANGFGELTDAVRQKELLEADKKKREELGREVYPVDEEFISALTSGMPSAGGIALGMDRMIMLFTAANDINEVIFQSAADAIKKE